MIADDSMHVIGTPMDTLGIEIQRRYNRKHTFLPRVDRVYWRDDFLKFTDEEENKNDIDNDNKNEGGTN